MSTQSLIKTNAGEASVFDDFLKPWNEWFDNAGYFPRKWTVPAVNITETRDEFLVAMAAPGMKKEDFNIGIDGNLLTISTEKEETKEEKEKKFTRKEYSYSSFSRSFTLPEEVAKDKIEARYEDGVLKVSLPRKDQAKLVNTKKIDVK